MSNEMLAAVVGGTVGAIGGALGTWAVNRLSDRSKLRDHAKQETVLDLLGFLSRVLNREAPNSVTITPEEVSDGWAQRYRALYLLAVPQDHRERLDTLMREYVSTLESFRSNPARRPDVEKRREAAREEAFQLMRRLGL